MNIRVIKELLKASIIEGKNKLDVVIEHVCASDIISDILTFNNTNSILLTGLINHQVIISAFMAEFKGIIFVEGKKPAYHSRKFARDNNLVLISTLFLMDQAWKILESARKDDSLEKEILPTREISDGVILTHEFYVKGDDFANAGNASTNLKSILKKIGLEPKLIRRVAICAYEGEMNIIMHAIRGSITLSITPKIIEIIVNDEGKGIADIGLAMQEGYTTATKEMIAMGFGSGIGLPNIKKNSDEFHIESTCGKGTNLNIKFYP